MEEIKLNTILLKDLGGSMIKIKFKDDKGGHTYPLTDVAVYTKISEEELITKILTKVTLFFVIGVKGYTYEELKTLNNILFYDYNQQIVLAVLEPEEQLEGYLFIMTAPLIMR